MAILTSWLYGFHISANYFLGIDELILMFMLKGKRPRIANSVLKKKEKIGELTLPDIETFSAKE